MEESLTQNLTESIKNVLGLKEISPAQLSPLVLAYIGDSIFDLVIKTYLLDTKGNMQVNKLNRFASNIVKAQSQSEMIGIIEPLLSPAEEAVYKRGRNAKSYTSAKMLQYQITEELQALRLLWGICTLKVSMSVWYSL